MNTIQYVRSANKLSNKIHSIHEHTICLRNNFSYSNEMCCRISCVCVQELIRVSDASVFFSFSMYLFWLFTIDWKLSLLSVRPDLFIRNERVWCVAQPGEKGEQLLFQTHSMGFGICFGWTVREIPRNHTVWIDVWSGRSRGGAVRFYGISHFSLCRTFVPAKHFGMDFAKYLPMDSIPMLMQTK